MKKEEKSNRRKFLTIGVLGGTGILASATLGKIPKAESPAKMQMMTADGKLVEVERDQVPEQEKKKPISNAELRDWMNTNETQ